ncbi:hypothetical protein [Spirosoma arcticum]
MKKHYLICVLLAIALLPGYGQGVADYYRTSTPDRSAQYNRLLTRYGGPHIRDRWYASLDGFVRTDRAQMDNSLNGQIESDRVTKVGVGAVIGWAYRERWAIEGGYARMPIHTQVLIRNGVSPLVYRYTNGRSAFVLRGKRLALSTSGPWLRSGFWLSGGLWLVPNGGQPEGNFALQGYRYRGRGESPDTLNLFSQTRVGTRMTTMAELGAEYNVRLSDNVDLGFSVRKFWGLASSIVTNVDYTVNQTLMQQAQLKGTGTGMSYGVTLRYTFAIRRNLPNALDVRGNGHIR